MAGPESESSIPQTKQGVENANINSQAYRTSRHIREGVNTSDSGLDVDCDKINQDLAALASTPEQRRQQLIEATAFRLEQKNSAYPDLPQIELLKSEESKLAVRVTDKDGHSKVCLPANETDASRYKLVKGSFNSVSN